jgi:membrane protein implicated in regulation of membrane protease activity
MTDSWAIAAFVFLLLGAIFTLVGMALTLGIITAFVGIPFAGLGILFLGAGVAVAGWRYQEAQKSVRVLRTGDAVEGLITQTEENLHVRVGELSYQWADV